MSNDFVEPGDLSGFPGAPFDGAVVDAAVDMVRSAAGWHIAPSRAETVVVEGRGAVALLLRTLHLTEVTTVRNLATDSPVTDVLHGATDEFTSGIVTRRGGARWPDEQIELAVKHGFTKAPAALLAVVAEVARWTRSNTELQSRSLGSLSQTWRTGLSDGNAAVLGRYSIEQAP